ncbi:MAG: TIGR04100 family radical SAM protein [Oscillospiraceae bacterium]|nr:TIGR04100 family radical SAM protein [Oscillospiraceae bacterium]
MTIAYAVKGNLYLNLTNRCPCACTFCIRANGDGVYGSDSLWLEREPTAEEVIACLNSLTMSQYGEVVFCGYGEPMERAADVALLGRYIKETFAVATRLNTNGLGDKINGKPTAELLAGAVDTVSISLNAGTKEGYMSVTRPKWDDSFEAMLKFAADCKKHIQSVVFTVVDVLTAEDLEKCREISKNMGIPLRIRGYD